MCTLRILNVHSGYLSPIFFPIFIRLYYHKYLLSSCYELGILLVSGVTAVNTTHKDPHSGGVYILVKGSGGDTNKQIQYVDCLVEIHAIIKVKQGEGTLKMEMGYFKQIVQETLLRW